jgi:hypothetical protein
VLSHIGSAAAASSSSSASLLLLLLLILILLPRDLEELDLRSMGPLSPSYEGGAFSGEEVVIAGAAGKEKGVTTNRWDLGDAGRHARSRRRASPNASSRVNSSNICTWSGISIRALI